MGRSPEFNYKTDKSLSSPFTKTKSLWTKWNNFRWRKRHNVTFSLSYTPLFSLNTVMWIDQEFRKRVNNDGDTDWVDWELRKRHSNKRGHREQTYETSRDIHKGKMSNSTPSRSMFSYKSVKKVEIVYLILGSRTTTTPGDGCSVVIGSVAEVLRLKKYFSSLEELYDLDPYW